MPDSRWRRKGAPPGVAPPLFLSVTGSIASNVERLYGVKPDRDSVRGGTDPAGVPDARRSGTDRIVGGDRGTYHGSGPRLGFDGDAPAAHLDELPHT